MHYTNLKKKIEQLLIFFRRLGSLHNLSFTNLEILRDKIIGLDARRRKLLIVQDNNHKYDSKIIDLYEVSTCRVKKIYSSVDSVSFKKNKIGEYLSAIAIEFDFKNGGTPVALVFYKDMNYPVNEMAELEYKTKNMEMTLSKMLSVHEQKSA
jgi:hypothetical protein